MKKADVVRDLNEAIKQTKFAADFIDLFGYSFSEVEGLAAKDKEVNALLLKYNEMIDLYEQKLYFEGLKVGRFQNILEKRLEKSGFIGATKLELSGSLPEEIVNNIKDFFSDNS